MVSGSFYELLQLTALKASLRNKIDCFVMKFTGSEVTKIGIEVLNKYLELLDSKPKFTGKQEKSKIVPHH